LEDITWDAIGLRRISRTKWMDKTKYYCSYLSIN